MSEKNNDTKDQTYLVDDPNVVKMMKEGLFNKIPHANTIGVEFVSIERRKACLKIPYKKELAGNLSTGTIHGGVIISLMDSAAGMAVFASLPTMEAIATLDLRVDYLKPATIGKDVYGTVECYKLTNSIAFVRGFAYQDNEDDLVATCTGTFMRASNQQGATPLGKNNGKS